MRFEQSANHLYITPSTEIKGIVVNKQIIKILNVLLWYQLAKSSERIRFIVFKSMCLSRPLLVHLHTFHITIQLQIEKVLMLGLGLEPGPQDGRRRQIHWAMAFGLVFWATDTLLVSMLNFFYKNLLAWLGFEPGAGSLDEKCVWSIPSSFVALKLIMV